MILSLIAAIGKNNELGKGNTLLWHMPADMKHFRETTSGHAVIMGRKTFESLPGGPLPKRRNIVITRDNNYARDGIEVAHSLEEAIEKVKDEDEVFVIGGAEIYKLAMPEANRLYITHIDAGNKDADAFFPEIIPVVWNEVAHEEHPADEKNPHGYIFSTYEKIV
ncbi:MAG TPA: dihydrofolate reductase [Candidatus Paceibacterota bacterium]|nr:dihydrofolate reductase [Candidatus Paceibacterota bacterium]